MNAPTHPCLDLPRALERLGLPPAAALRGGVAERAALLLGIEPPLPAHATLDRVRRDSRLVSLVREKLAERFPDLVIAPGRAQGRALSPVGERLRRLLDGIPETEQACGLRFEDLRRRLAGKYGRTARHDEVADALRALGWARVRDWRDVDGGFRSAWFPPSASEPPEPNSPAKAPKTPAKRPKDPHP
jgi:hypothetical protein